MYNIFKPLYPDQPELQKGFRQGDYTPWAYNYKRTRGHRLTTPVDYFNQSEVLDALHIPSNYPVWAECKQDINYTMFRNGSQWIWEEMRGKYKMLKFSGDIDAEVSTVGSLGWINALNWPIIEPWRQYKVGGQVGGWIEERDGMTFASINGAGHMVPQDKPEVAFHLIFNWLRGDPI